MARAQNSSNGKGAKFEQQQGSDIRATVRERSSGNGKGVKFGQEDGLVYTAGLGGVRLR